MDKYFTANAVLSIFSKNYMELKKGLPIRPSEMGVLNIVAETPGPHTPVLLAEFLEVSKPMITAHLTSLAEKGFITKEQSPDDRRVYYIRLTEKALTLVERVKADMTRQLEQLVDAMGQDEFDNLVRLAQKANKAFDANREKTGEGV